jgi:glycosyltransferase involved in cell wall biosynthesis
MQNNDLLAPLSALNGGSSPQIADCALAEQWFAETTEFTAEQSLRVLIVLSQQPSETGSGVYLREVVSELQKLGHKPYLLAAHYRPLSDIDFPSLSNDQIYTMIFNNTKNSDRAEISFPIPGMSLDMPYLHLPFRALSDSMLNEYCNAWISKIRSVVEKVRPHIIHVNHLWLLPGIARAAVPWVPIVATSHGTDYKLLVDSPRFGPGVLPGVQSLDMVMPISHDTADASIRDFGVRPEKVHIIGNGYNRDLFQVLPRDSGNDLLRDILARYNNLSSWKKLVLYVGKFADFKGIPYLIRAAKIYSGRRQDDVLTLIVGEGSRQVRESLQRLVDDLGLSKKVLLPGKVPYHHVGPLMNRADVFVLPSVNEPFGLVLLEALACGLRSVAAERGGPEFFVPQSLRERGLVTLIKPLNLLKAELSDPNDEARYVADLAAAVSNHLSHKQSECERQLIANAVSDQIWSTKVGDIVQVYIRAIRLRRQAIIEDLQPV